MLAAGEIDEAAFVEMVASSAPSPGHCNTMGTASTMNSLAEALGMSLPGSAAIPAPHRDRARNAYLTGRRIVEMVAEDLKPSDILTREAFENAIVVNSAIGGSTNAPIHIGAIARHIGVDLPLQDWQRLGLQVPLLVDLQPAGKYLGEEYFRAGGVPAVVHELMAHGLIHEDARTVNGRTIGENCRDAAAQDRDVIRTFDTALIDDAGFVVLTGNLFDSAIMKTSVISKEFRERYLSDPEHPNVFSGRAVVFDGPRTTTTASTTRRSRSTTTACSSSAAPGRSGTRLGGGGQHAAARRAHQAGVLELPCIGDGRQSGTSARRPS
jgi:dihydroxy-acid dehydratase